MTLHDIKAVYLIPVFLPRAITYIRTYMKRMYEMKNIDSVLAKKYAKLIESELVQIQKSLNEIDKKLPMKSILSMFDVKSDLLDETSKRVNSIYIAADESINLINKDGKTFFVVENFEVTHKGMPNTHKIDILRQMLEDGASDSEIVLELKKIIDK